MNISLGNIILKARKSNNWTARDLIGRLNVKVSPAYLTKIEIHNETPTPEVIKDISRALGLDSSELMSITKEMIVKRLKDKLDSRYI
jgi:transcriptional regulator with XRE-family HTH domain